MGNELALRRREEFSIMADQATLRTVAERLRSASGFSPIDTVHDELDGIEDAYEVQAINRAEWISQGRLFTGYKVAFTTLESQQIFGTHEPAYGTLFEDMRFPSGGTIPAGRLAHPKLEGEIVLELGRDLPAKTLPPEEVAAAVGAYYVALEIPDGSFAGKFDATDMAADNAAAAGYVLGDRRPMTPETDLAALSMEMEHNGGIVSTGEASTCMGNPLNVLIWLQEALARRHEGLKAGQIIYCGSLVPIIQVKPGDAFRATVEGAGSASCHFAAD